MERGSHAIYCSIRPAFTAGWIHGEREFIPLYVTYIQMGTDLKPTL